MVKSAGTASCAILIPIKNYNGGMYPLSASLQWWSIHIGLLCEGMEKDAARREASHRCGLSGKDFTRCLIAGDMMLSFPLEGGAGLTKRLRADSNSPTLILSDHGKWRREHLGALATEYGRTPFFIHLFPELTRIYDDSEKDKRVSSLAEAFYQETLKWLSDYAAVRDALPHNPSLRARAEELKRNVNKDYSIFDAIFRFGKETALCL